MRTFPDESTFNRTYHSGAAQVLWTRLVSDLDTPVSAMLKLVRGRPNAFLLESVTGGSVRGRYSLLGLKPDLIWRSRGMASEINRTAATDPKTFTACEGNPLDVLTALLEESRIDLPAELPPMSAGLFGYLGYDMVRLMEKLPDSNPDDLNLEDSIMIRPTVMAIFDGIENVVTVVTPVRPQPGVSAAWARGACRCARGNLKPNSRHSRRP